MHKQITVYIYRSQSHTSWGIRINPMADQREGSLGEMRGEAGGGDIPFSASSSLRRRTMTRSKCRRAGGRG